MKEKPEKHIFLSYLHQYMYTTVMFVIYTGIFVWIFLLYDMETEAVLYAAGVCVLFTGLLFAGTYL